MAIQTLNTIKNWFKTGLKPSQEQFWDTWDSFRHKNEKLSLRDVENLETTLNSRVEKSELDTYKTSVSELLNTKENKANKGVANGYAPLNNFTKLASQYLDIINDLVSGGVNSLLSAEQGKILQNQINQIKTLLSSDNVNLNSLQKIVDTVVQIQLSLNTILVNDLISGGTTKALSAEMGKKLNEIKLTATIATDAEAQTSVAVNEDNKIVSRSKLFNWWNWIKSQSQNISGTWNFVNLSFGISGYFTSDSTRFYIRAYNDKQLNIGVEGVSNDAILINANGVQLNDKISLTSGTTTKAPLTIPAGTLLSTPINGALETNTSGIYYTVGGIRRNLITESVIDTLTMNTNVYLWGNGNIGIREDIFPLISNMKVFNDYTTNQYGRYSINVSGIISRMNTMVSDVKFELQMLISNSKTPSTWYTISKFEDTRTNIFTGDSLPQQIKLSAELLLEALYSKFIYATGCSSTATTESFFKTKTSDLATSQTDPKREEMLVSFRIKATTNWTTAITTQEFLANFGLIKMIKI